MTKSEIRDLDRAKMGWYVLRIKTSTTLNQHHYENLIHFRTCRRLIF